MHWRQEMAQAPFVFRLREAAQVENAEGPEEEEERTGTNKEVVQWRGSTRTAPVSAQRSPLSALPFLQMPARVDIAIIHTPAQILQDVAPRLRSATVIGLDAEWRPSSSGKETTSKRPATVLQLATWDTVYVVDLMALTQGEEDDSHRLAAASAIFDALQRRSCTVIGFGSPQEDIDRVHWALYRTDSEREMRADAQSSHRLRLSSRVVDLQSLFIASQVAAFHIDDSLGRAQKLPSLSNVSRMVLGAPLDKSMQLSNWHERPLSHEQIRYAAMDAHVLLRLHAVLRGMGRGGRKENRGERLG